MGWIARTRNTPFYWITNPGGSIEAAASRSQDRDLDPRPALLLNLDPIVVKVVIRTGKGERVIDVLIVSDTDKRQLPRDTAIRRGGEFAQVNNCTGRYCGDLNCSAGPLVVDPDSLRVVVGCGGCVYNGEAQGVEPA